MRVINGVPVGTVLIGASATSAPSLPLVGAVQVDIQLLAGPESIAAGDAQPGLRAVAAVGASVEDGLYVEIVRLIEYAQLSDRSSVSVPGRG